MCLIFLVMLFSPRLAILLWYLFDPNRWERAFDTWYWPLLGAIFLPWTTLMFVGVAPSGNLGSGDWFWLSLAFLIDLFSLLGNGYSNRNRIPGYTNY